MIAFICLAKVKPLGAIASLITPFATGVLYGLMSLGRKADREQMLQSARAENYTQFENEEPWRLPLDQYVTYFIRTSYLV